MRWIVLAMLSMAAVAQEPKCSLCAVWNVPRKPFKIYGNTYYVGPHGLSSVLIAGDGGLVLIDTALPESAAQIAANIRALGFRVEDVKYILSGHVHFDHAGGIAELQRLSGATVVASAWNIGVLQSGGVAKDDPQFGDIRGIAPVRGNVRAVKDGETVRVGGLAVTAHATPGHTPGGMSWTWQACEAGKCLDVVYADSVTAVSAPGYRFADHPALLAGFAKSFAFLESAPCDVLLTAHPEAADLWGQTADGTKELQAEPGGCAKLTETGREGLKKRLEMEKQGER
jgi:metallo-beta-lactamase class B